MSKYAQLHAQYGEVDLGRCRWGLKGLGKGLTWGAAGGG